MKCYQSTQIAITKYNFNEETTLPLFSILIMHTNNPPYSFFNQVSFNSMWPRDRFILQYTSQTGFKLTIFNHFFETFFKSGIIFEKNRICTRIFPYMGFVQILLDSNVSFQQKLMTRPFMTIFAQKQFS